MGPPHKQRYMQFTGQPAADADVDAAAAAAAAAQNGGQQQQQQECPSSAGALMSAVKHQLLQSAAFARLLKAMLDVEILKHAGEVRRFRAGERSVMFVLKHTLYITTATPETPEMAHGTNGMRNRQALCV